MNPLRTRPAVLLSSLGLYLSSSNDLVQTYAADRPEALLTPDVAATERLGTWHFFDGIPAAQDRQAESEIFGGY